MAHVVATPPRELMRLAGRIESGCRLFLVARGHWAVTTQWEALRHAWTLSNLSLRQTEATVVLAKTDLVMLPAAWVTARAAVEAAARCLWLLEPTDVWEREARWLALMEEGARLGDRAELSFVPSAAPEAASIRAFTDAVKARLPEGVTVPRTPTAQKMLASEGMGLAAFYTFASQYVHATEFGTRQWRANLGVDAAYFERVDLESWHLPLWMSWLAFRITVVRLMEAKGEDLPNSLALVDNQIIDARDAFVASLPRRLVPTSEDE